MAETSEFDKIDKARAVVEVYYRESERGPLLKSEYWFCILPWAVYEHMLPKLRRLLTATEKMCPEDWHREFNPWRVPKAKGKRR